MPLHPLQEAYASRYLHEIQEGRSGPSCCIRTFSLELQHMSSSYQILDKLTARRHYSKASYSRKVAFDLWLRAVRQQTLNSTASSSARIINFYSIFSSLTPELKTQILSHLDLPSLLRVSGFSAPEPILWCAPWKLSCFGTIAEACVDVDTILEESSQHLLKLIIREQYPVEAFVCTSSLRSFTDTCREPPPTTNITLSQRPMLMYLHRLWQIESMVCKATHAVQSVFPRMAQTALVRDTLTYMFEWACGVDKSHDPLPTIQHQWNVFGRLPHLIKLEISTFFDNMAEEFLDTATFDYPSVCRTPICPNRSTSSPPRHVARCDCCGLPFCWWRLPNRVVDELDTLGVTRLLARSYAMRRVRTLLDVASQICCSYNKPPDLHSLDDFFISKLYGGFSWEDALYGAEVIFHGPGADIVMYLPAYRILITLFGKRGCGTIEIKVPLQFCASFHDPHFLMLSAMASDTPVDIEQWNKRLVADDGVLLVIDREAYWDVLEVGRVQDGLLAMLQ